MITIQTRMKECCETIGAVQKKLLWYVKYYDQLINLKSPELFGDSLDFNFPDREQTLEIIKSFPGKWNKVVEGNQFNYILKPETPIMDVVKQVRIYGGTPPPTCQLVEVEEIVPAQPEHVKKKMVWKCTNGVDEL